MKAWKRRFKRFEGYYRKGKLLKQFTNEIIKKDGPEVLANWFDYCRQTHGDIKQVNLYEQGN